ncbi:MAG: biotin/lipoyl-binding protein, partial [Gammaproteobacteria bacterium]|nr:biotin/lipoyl-binding protein [Gammaproteobacteria bacterium]
MEPVADKKALLDALRIDRDAPEQRAEGRPLKWLVAIALAGGVGFVMWFVVFPAPRDAALLTVRTVVVRGAAPAGASVLDATGYVVARRQATVSSKVTGKVEAVLIEEGMAVEKGQLLAQLDDSIPRAQLELADARRRALEAALEELHVGIRQAQLDLER